MHCVSTVLLHSCIDFLLIFWSALWFIQTKTSLDDLICTLNLASKIRHLQVIWVENGWHQKFVNSTSNLQVKISYSVLKSNRVCAKTNRQEKEEGKTKRLLFWVSSLAHALACSPHAEGKSPNFALAWVSSLTHALATLAHPMHGIPLAQILPHVS